MDLNQIYSLARQVETSESKLTKYHYIGYYLNKNIRVFNVNLMSKFLCSDCNNSLPDNLIEFVLSEKETIFIPNILDNSVIEIICRSINSKRFINISDGLPSMFYNIGGLSKTRHFTDKIIICEGTADCEYIKHYITEDVLACLTDSISATKLEILKTLTNHVVLSFDNDESGENAKIRETKKLKRCGFFVEYLSPPPYVKDFGDMFSF